MSSNGSTAKRGLNTCEMQLKCLISFNPIHFKNTLTSPRVLMGLSKPNANIAQLPFLLKQSLLKPAETSIGMFIQLLSKESET